MQRDYYSQYYYLERQNWWFLVRFEIIKNTIIKHVYKGTPLKILNIGVATGAGSDMLAQFGEVVSSEYDEATCAFIKSHLKMDVVQASVTQLPFGDNMFDLVCAFDVIEHVDDDFKAYSEMKRVCKNNGHIAVTVPAYMMMWSAHDVVNHHCRRYTKKDIKQLLAKNELKVRYSSYFNTILFIPILMVRMFNNLLKHDKLPVSDFQTTTSSWINKMLKSIFSIELLILKITTLPFGVSYFNISEKTD